MKSIEEQKGFFLTEEAITSLDDDLFDFKSYATKIQKLIQNNSSNPNPLTIGIYGKWGSGKTSFLNLIEKEIDIFFKNPDQKGIIKYYFNPWRYSSEDELLFDFFDGLAKTLQYKGKGKGKKIGEGIIKLSRYLKAVKFSARAGINKSNSVGVTFEPSELFQELGGDIKGKPMTIESLKEEINLLIEEAKFKVIVFLDDLDRLDKDEIYAILKLVKLNANFKNFVYIITLDQEHIAKAISARYGQNISDGYSFLDKIINIPVHLPRIRPSNLFKFFEHHFLQIKNSLSLKNEYIRNKEFELIYDEFRNEIFKTPREIIKVLNGFFISAFAIGDEVNLRDLFWLECLKLRNEEFYTELKNFDLSSGLLIFEDIVDFNDGETRKIFPNGTRLIFKEKYPNEFYLFEKLFPEIRKAEYTLDQVDKQLAIKSLRINAKVHYEKYFTLDLGLMISNGLIVSIEESTRKNDVEEIKANLLDFLECDVSGDGLFQFISLINKITKRDGSISLFKVVFQNIKKVPKTTDNFGRNNNQKIIEIIAENLDKDESVTIDEISSVVDSLDIYDLALVVRVFKNRNPLKNTLEVLLTEKVKSFQERDPFYHNARRMESVVIMITWNKVDKETFKNYIQRKLILKENFDEFIILFPPFYNNEFYGSLWVEQYDRIKLLVDIFFLIDKLKEFYHSIYYSVNKDTRSFGVHDESSLPDFIYQLSYWYLNEFNNIDNDPHNRGAFV